MMKNLLQDIQSACRHAAFLLPALALLLAAGCIKEDMTGSTGKATVTMTFTTRAATAASTDGTLADNEHMRTLRVIVVRQSTNEIVYNVSYDIEKDATSKTITFSELTVNENGETFDFYAVANETPQMNLGNLTSAGLIDLYKKILIGGFQPTDRLPQAAREEITVKPGENNTATMQLRFPVGKIVLNFKNETGEEVTLTDVKIAGVAPNQAYLFYQNAVPDGTTYTGDVVFTYPDATGNEDTEITEGTVIVPTGTETEPGIATTHQYIYPGSAGAGKYKLTANWNNDPKEVLLAITNETTNTLENISSILRDQQLVITVTLKHSGGFGVQCEVQDWNVESHDYMLSDGGTFAVAAPNAKEFTYEVQDVDATQVSAIATQYSVEAGASARYATFTIRMDAPKGVRWIAHLSNAVDFELVVDEDHATEGVGGAGDVTVMIRPTSSYDATAGRKTTELYVTTGLNNERMKFVNPGDYCSSDGVTIPIVQVSAAEGDNLWNTTTEP